MTDGVQILVAVCDRPRTVAVKPLGRCRIGVCDVFQRFVRRFHTPDTTDIFFDLSGAESIDSTFAGILVALATKKRHPETPDVHLVHPSPSVTNTLTTMHVLPLFDICEAMPDSPTQWTALHAEPLRPDQVPDLVIDAHQALIDADERNEAEFGPVVDVFRAEQQRQASLEAPQ